RHTRYSRDWSSDVCSSDLRGMAVAQKNTQNGISMMQTAEGAFTELTNVLLRMKDLATEAFNASTTAADKAALQAEYDALGLELADRKSTRLNSSHVKNSYA